MSSEENEDFDALLAEIASAPPVTGAGDADLMIGRVLGRYRVVDRLGRGGMGVVYRAFDPELERDVALKLLPIEASADEARRARFAREARASAKLAHPHIAAIYDVGFDETSGVAYIAMEVVRGRDLRHVISAGAPSVADVERWALQIARASACAHAAGIVHRDLKPENVMIDVDGNVKILDFGLAARVVDSDRVVAPGESSGTTTGVAGTPGYMAPEQKRGERVDARADVYAIGVVVRELLAGRSSSALDDAVAQCLNEDAGRRFEDGGALADAIAVRVSSVATPPIGAASMHATTRRRRAPIVVAAAIVVAVAGVAGGVVADMKRVQEPPHLASVPIVSDDPAEQAAFRSAVIAHYEDLTTGARMAADVAKKDPDAAGAWIVAACVPDSVGANDFWEVIAKARAATKRRHVEPSLVDFLDFIEPFQKGVPPERVAHLDDEVARFIDQHPGDYFVDHMARVVAGRPPQEMLASLGRLWAIDHGPIGDALEYADGLAVAGKRDDARRVLDEVLRMHPGHHRALNEKAALLYNERKLDDAQRIIEELEKKKPDFVAPRGLLLTIALDKDDRATEERELRALSSGTMPPFDAGIVLQGYAFLLATQGRVHDAVRVIGAAADVAKPLGPRSPAMTVADFMNGVTLPRAWPESTALAAMLDRLAAVDGFPDGIKATMKRISLRALCERDAFSGHVDDADRELAALEALPDSAFFDSKDEQIAIDRALVLAAHGKRDEAFRTLRGKTPTSSGITAFIDAGRRLQVADLAGDVGEATKAADELAAMAETCARKDGTWERMCRIHVAWAFVIGAERAHAAGDDVKARAFLERFDAWWPHADADTPAKLRAVALRTALGP